MSVPNETILTYPLGSSTAASEAEHYVRKNEFDTQVNGLQEQVDGLTNNPIVSAIRSGTTQALDSDTNFIFNTESFDTAAIYNNATGIVTFATAGKYLIVASCLIDNSAGSTDYIFLQTSGGGSACKSAVPASICSVPVSAIVEVGVGDTARIYIQTGSSATLGVGSSLLVWRVA